MHRDRLPMPLEPPLPVDTRSFFRPASGSLIALLRNLPDDRWNDSTVAGAWVVRDIRLSDDTAWRVLFNALPEAEAVRRVDVQGAAELGRAFLRARSVIV